MQEVRIDKWLWAMRIFKTRTIATDACKKGRVGVGNAPSVKPSRMISVGDVVHVRKPPVTFSFEVLKLTENRLGARLVPDYARNVTEQSQLDLLEVVKISGFVNRAKGLGRQLAEFADSVGDDGWDFDSDDFEGFDD